MWNYQPLILKRFYFFKIRQSIYIDNFFFCFVLLLHLLSSECTALWDKKYKRTTKKKKKGICLFWSNENAQPKTMWGEGKKKRGKLAVSGKEREEGEMERVRKGGVGVKGGGETLEKQRGMDEKKWTSYTKLLAQEEFTDARWDIWHEPATPPPSLLCPLPPPTSTPNTYTHTRWTSEQGGWWLPQGGELLRPSLGTVVHPEAQHPSHFPVMLDTAQKRSTSREQSGHRGGKRL